MFLLFNMVMLILRIIYMVDPWLFVGSHFLVLFLLLWTPPLLYIVKWFIHHLFFWPHALGRIYYACICHLHRLGESLRNLGVLALSFSQLLFPFRALLLPICLIGGDAQWLFLIALPWGGDTIPPCTTVGGDSLVASRESFYKDEFQRDEIHRWRNWVGWLGTYSFNAYMSLDTSP